MLFQLDNDGPEMHGLYAFAIITEERELLLAANSEEEKYKWMEVRFFVISIIEDLELRTEFCFLLKKS